MEIEVKTKQTIESISMIKIEVPSYWKVGNHLFKVSNEKDVLSIYDYSGLGHFALYKESINNIDFPNATEITHEMFTEKYEQVIDIFNQL